MDSKPKKKMYQSVFTEGEKESIQGRESIKGTRTVGVMSRETLAHWKTCCVIFPQLFPGNSESDKPDLRE